MKYLISLLIVLTAYSGYAVAGAPTGRNTSVSLSFDRLTPPPRFDIWIHEPTGYDLANPAKWGRNTLTCLSRTATEFGACMTAPAWTTASVAPMQYPILLQFTHTQSNQKININVYAEKHMFLIGKTQVYPSFITTSTSSSGWGREPYFDFYIVRSELEKLKQPGIWTATLKQNLREWGLGSCSGNATNITVGCPGYEAIASWQANLQLEVIDYSNRQIYLPAFPHSTPVVNLNLSNYPGRPGGGEVKGDASLDMCLYDGSNSSNSRITLRFSDDDSKVEGRPDGAFSVWRRGSDHMSAVNRVDYRVSITNPLTGIIQPISNGTEIVWQGANDRRFLRPVVLPGGNESVLCVPAPIKLTTPGFIASSKTAGDYTGVLHIIYTPSTL